MAPLGALTQAWTSADPLPLDWRVTGLYRTLAGEFDPIEPEATYPAATFVEWLAGESSCRKVFGVVNLKNQRKAD